eukprot:9904733-Prorocentrum_lima.AAC.1
MTSSLVGSEMCIRDRGAGADASTVCVPLDLQGTCKPCHIKSRRRLHDEPVSYTHLTLPTICSV